MRQYAWKNCCEAKACGRNGSICLTSWQFESKPEFCARFRNSTAIADPLVPGQVYEYKIDLWSTSNVFLKGHRIRLEISSSNFPRFDRNLNTGRSAADDAAFVKATNTILHDSEHPSALVLPVVAR